MSIICFSGIVPWAHMEFALISAFGAVFIENLNAFV